MQLTDLKEKSPSEAVAMLCQCGDDVLDALSALAIVAMAMGGPN